MLRDASLWCLYIEDTCDADEGEYVIKASNQHGVAEVAIHLTVLSPQPPQGMDKITPA